MFSGSYDAQMIKRMNNPKDNFKRQKQANKDQKTDQDKRYQYYRMD